VRTAGAAFIEAHLQPVSGPLKDPEKDRKMGEIIRKMKQGKFIGWYLRYVDADGKRKQRASKQPSHAEARRMLIEIEARIARGLVGMTERQPQTRMTLEELFKQYLVEYRNPRCKDIEAYRRCARVQLTRVTNAAPKIAQLALSSIENSHLAKARDALMTLYPAGTVRTSFNAVSAALSWAVREKLIEKNPAQGLKKPPAPPARLEFLTTEEVRSLLDNAQRLSRDSVGKTKLIWACRHVAISLAVQTGMRKGEIFGLRWQEIDFDGRRLTIARSYDSTPKNGKTRHVRLPTVLAPLLQEWRASCPSKELVCPTWQRGSWEMSRSKSDDHDLPELMQRAGCRPLSRPWHLLRHTFASHFMQSGGSLLALSQILGHSDVKMTMVYAHLGSDFLAEQIDKVRF
jgi:integrase